jgi:N-methylhydantoinase B
VIQPIFHEGELEGYAATMAHHVDVGGSTPGSIAVHATEIYQEGCGCRCSSSTRPAARTRP